MTDLSQFPGFLGYGGIIAIHANWPIYSPGIGWEIALRSLGNYPKGTKFYQIDDIDQCKLLINKVPKNLKDPYDYQHYHIAIWNEDLIELNAQGLVKGISAVSEYEFDLFKYEEFKKELGENVKIDINGNIILYYKNDKGEYKEALYKKPIPYIFTDNEEEDDDDFENEYYYNSEDWVIIKDYIYLSDKGYQKIKELSQNTVFSEKLNEITKPLIQIKKYDTAIRDASILIETSIKKFHKLDLYGQKLLDFHIKDVIKHNDNNYSAAIKCYRGELRTIFKYIRNDYIHNFKVLSEEQCRTILYRINETLNEFKEVKEVYYK